MSPRGRVVLVPGHVPCLQRPPPSAFLALPCMDSNPSLLAVPATVHRIPGRKPPREPPPPYEVASTPFHSHEPSEDTPLLRPPSPVDPVSPRRMRRPLRLARSGSYTVSLASDIHSPVSPLSETPLPLSRRLRRYFRPLGRREYWLSAFHLTVVNFPFALCVPTSSRGIILN